MKDNYSKAISFVFQYEGGYTNHPSDPGGPTNWGITIHDAKKYWKSDATAADVKAMPKSVAEEIYRTRYARPIYFDNIAPGLDACTLDSAINSGVGRADDWLAYSLGLKAGPSYDKLATLSQTVPLKDLPAKIKLFCSKRLSFLQGLKTWGVFGKGWGRRVSALEVLAVQMALKSAGKPAGEIKKDLQAEVATTKGTQSSTATKGGTVVAAETAHAWSFWEWDFLHVSLAIAGLVLVAYFVHNFIQNHTRLEEYNKAIAELESV